MNNPVKDSAVALGAVLTLLTIWSFVDMFKSKSKTETQMKVLHSKIDAIASKLKT